MLRIVEGVRAAACSRAGAAQMSELRRVGEEAAGEVGAGVRLEPGDGVEHVVAELLHREAEREDDVLRAGDPQRPRRLEHAAARGEPGAVKVVVGVDAARGVPAALVDRDARARPGRSSRRSTGCRAGRRRSGRPTRPAGAEQLDRVALHAAGSAEPAWRTRSRTSLPASFVVRGLSRRAARFCIPPCSGRRSTGATF